MGFSVSGSTAIIFIAAIVSFGVMYTSAYNSYELMDAAEDEKTANLLEQQNTEIEIVAIQTFTSNNTVDVTVKNTGATELHVGDTDLLLNGAYQSGVNTLVDGQSGRTLWLPGENLTMEASFDPTGTVRVKVITTRGNAVYQEVTT